MKRLIQRWVEQWRAHKGHAKACSICNYLADAYGMGSPEAQLVYRKTWELFHLL